MSSLLMLHLGCRSSWNSAKGVRYPGTDVPRLADFRLYKTFPLNMPKRKAKVFSEFGTPCRGHSVDLNRGLIALYIMLLNMVSIEYAPLKFFKKIP
jgi:hypothetical protein